MRLKSTDAYFPVTPLPGLMPSRNGLGRYGGINTRLLLRLDVA
jgi:hypothetical protein